MNLQSIPRWRIIVAAMVPFIILALIGLGLTVFQAYRLCFWGKTEATFIGSEPVIIERGSSTDHTYSMVHYRFTKQGGGDVHLSFLERASSTPREKTITILYSPSVVDDIRDTDGIRWDYASSVYVLMCVGMGMTTAGVLPCLLGAVLLVREWRKPPMAIPLFPPPG
jgi:hypothetical protein